MGRPLLAEWMYLELADDRSVKTDDYQADSALLRALGSDASA